MGDGDADPVATLRDRAPGEDPADPYADVDISTLPEWWRRSIREFESHGLRPYRPPRLADGTLKHEVVSALEADLGVDVGLRGVDVTHGEDWTVFVDGDRAGTVGRHRAAGGFSVFETTSEAFERLVRSAAAGDGTGDE